MKEFQVIILAGGDGRRMNSTELPKVLLPLSGKPLIHHALEAVIQSGLDERPAIVVGRRGEKISAALGDRYQYIYQYEPRGTGQAVLSAKKVLQHNARHVIVLPGDHPFVAPTLLRQLANAHLEGGTAVTLATSPVADYENQEVFSGYDRVARSSFGQVSRLLHPGFNRQSQELWPEVSPGYFCFQASWLWPNLYRLSTVNREKESCLSDLVNVALAERKLVTEVPVLPGLALGADTPEQLKYLETKAGAL